MRRGFEHLEDVESTVVVNVGDDDTFYGWHVSPDLDTVLYTLAGVEQASRATASNTSCVLVSTPVPML